MPRTQAYDKARDRLEAQYEAGVVVTDEATKPPPSCVEVSVASWHVQFGGGSRQKKIEMQSTAVERCMAFSWWQSHGRRGDGMVSHH